MARTHMARTHMARTIIGEIASLLEARRNCESSGNAEWLTRHTDRLRNIERELLPHGSGIDSGVTIDLEKSTPSRVVLRVPFHCMDPNGYYCGWRDYTVTVTPEFDGFAVRVAGRDYNDLKSYLQDVFSTALREPMPVGFWASDAA